jgi:hypothetical protein
MGVVYLAQHPVIGRKVAIKLLHAVLARDQDIVARFFNEARAIHMIAHENIVEILDFGQTNDGQPYFIMEYLTGESLSEAVGRGPMTPDQVDAIGVQMCRALSAAHSKGIVHRDLKPHNVQLCVKADGALLVKILDFGVAKILASPDGSQSVKTRTGSLMGTPLYMSPEQCKGAGLLDHRTDIYSLGVVLYQLLTGMLPFRGANKYSIIYQITQQDAPPPSTLRREVPVALDRIVRRAMNKDLAARYQSGDEMAQELIDALRAGLGEARREEFGDADKFAALRAMGFFTRFADPELWEVVRIGAWDRVGAGAQLVHEGEPGDFFCVLIEGEVRVTKNKKLLSVLGPGECFGEMAYLSLSSHERGASVTTSRDSRIMRIGVADLENASADCRSKFDRAFIGILVERLNLANTRLTSG